MPWPTQTELVTLHYLPFFSVVRACKNNIFASIVKGLIRLWHSCYTDHTIVHIIDNIFQNLKKMLPSLSALVLSPAIFDHISNDIKSLQVTAEWAMWVIWRPDMSRIGSLGSAWQAWHFVYTLHHDISSSEWIRVLNCVTTKCTQKISWKMS